MSGDTVRMTHPDLDLDEPVEMPASSVPFHAAAGWRVVEEPPAEAEPVKQDESGAANKAKPKPTAAKSTKEKD